MSNEHVIVALQANNRFVIYLKAAKLQSLAELETNDAINFDIHQDKYFVVYRSVNIIEVYQIEKYTYLQFKMILPFYKEFEGYKFVTNPLVGMEGLSRMVPQMIRSYKQNNLGVVMKHPTKNETRLFIFDIS